MAGLTGSFPTSPLPLPCGRLIWHKALVEALYALSTGSHPQDPWLKSCFIEPAYNCRIANGPWWDSNPGPFRPESSELGKCSFGWFIAYPPRSIGKVVGEIRIWSGRLPRPLQFIAAMVVPLWSRVSLRNFQPGISFRYRRHQSPSFRLVLICSRKGMTVRTFLRKESAMFSSTRRNGRFKSWQYVSKTIAWFLWSSLSEIVQSLSPESENFGLGAQTHESPVACSNLYEIQKKVEEKLTFKRLQVPKST